MVRIVPLLAKKKAGFIRAKGLSPQKVADSESSWATADVFQRKTFYNGVHFFVFWWNNGTDTTLYIKHKVSSDGRTWGDAVEDFGFSDGPGANEDIGSNIDVILVSATTCYAQFIGNNPQYNFPRLGTISDSAISWAIEWSASYATTPIVGGNVCLTPRPRWYYVAHGRHTVTEVDRLTLICPLEDVLTTYTGADVPEKSASTGGHQTLPYKTSDPYNCILILKDANDELFYTTINDSNRTVTLPMTSLNVILSSGFNSFSATSEAQNAGDPEIIHLVYIKSTGELCYRKFEDEAWSSETELVASGATYPVIALRKGKKLYVFYVKDGKIKLKKYVGSWHGEIEPFKKHTFDTPTYLSTNQVAQNGRICLVWTEGTESPYEVWFAYLMD